MAFNAAVEYIVLGGILYTVLAASPSEVPGPAMDQPLPRSTPPSLEWQPITLNQGDHLHRNERLL